VLLFSAWTVQSARAEVGEPAPSPSPIDLVSTDTAVEGGMMPIEAEDGGGMPAREMDETAPINIFPNPEVVKRLLFGRKPFVYDDRGFQDPMIIPWIRDKILVQELIAQAQAYRQEAARLPPSEERMELLRKALNELNRAIQIDPTDKLGKTAEAEKETIRKLMDATGDGTTFKPTPRKDLPKWIIINTRAVIYDQSGENDHKVLLGDDVLGINGVVPKYPDVKVVEVTRDTIVYEYDGERYPVKVEVPITIE
jgi:hypothetical protein